MKRSTLSSKSALLIFAILFNLTSFGQIAYQHVENKNFGLGSYGRIGADWSFENGGSIGRRLNLNNMGSIGGRLEEQDYLELAPALHFKGNPKDSSFISVQARFSFYSRSLSLFGNSTSTSIGGLAFAMPELFAEARHIAGTNFNVWIGARLYRGADVHIADHFYFNDHSGQGFGVEFKKTRFATLFIASTDTNSTVPPYFYLNISTGTPSLALRQRTVFTLEHDLTLNTTSFLTLLGEYHRLSDGGSSADTITKYNYPHDWGYVLGIRHSQNLNSFSEGSYNTLAVRYGGRIANGGDGGLSRTWLTFGAPNLETQNFKNAYSLSIVEEILLNLSKKYTFNGYVIYTKSKGAANGNNLEPTYNNMMVYNQKEDFAIGTRNTFYINNYFHILGELHYSSRADGDQPKSSVIKASIAPTLVPTGGTNSWIRPHLRFVCSVARFNDQAMNTLYSPYLEYVGAQRWGYYFGVKAEWWIW